MCVLHRGTHSILAYFVLVLRPFNIGIVVLCVSCSLMSDSLQPHGL